MTLITNKIEHIDVGARFEALDALIFRVPVVSSCIFYIPRFPSGTMWLRLVRYL